MTEFASRILRMGRGHLAVLVSLIAVTALFAIPNMGRVDGRTNRSMLVVSRALANGPDHIPPEMARQADTLLALTEDNARIFNAVGVMYASQGREQEAEALWAERPDYAAPLFLTYGRLAFLRGDIQNAYVWYQRALKFGGHVDTEAYLQLADAFRMKEQWTVAESVLTTAVEAGIDDRAVWYWLGMARSNQGRAREALLAWQQGLEAPEGGVGLSNLHYQIGLTLHRGPKEIRNVGAAMTAYSNAIALDDFPVFAIQRARAHFQLGYLLLRELSDVEGARSHLERAIAEDPKYYSAYLWYANALWESGDRNGAISAAEAAIEIEPDNVRAYVLLGSFYELEDRLEMALAYIGRAKTLDPYNQELERKIRQLRNHP